jgi:hypothetical protein
MEGVAPVFVRPRIGIMSAAPGRAARGTLVLTPRKQTPLQWLVSYGCSAPPLPLECWPRLESSAIMSDGRLHLSFNAFHDGDADV